MANFRESAFNLSPSRLRTSQAAKMVYAWIGWPLDALAQAAWEAARARFPTYCPEDALPYHGRDRSVRRGPLEPAESYRVRLLKWRSIAKGSGVGRAMLDDIAGYLTPLEARLRIWTETGVIYTLEKDGTFDITRVAPGLWNWDGQYPAIITRFWLVIYSIAGVPWSRDGTWNDGERWGDNAATATWGSTATIDQVQTIRAIVDDRKPAASICENIVISFDDAAFDPSNTAPPLPDGTWKNFSKNVAGVQVPARDDRAIYWEGVA